MRAIKDRYGFFFWLRWILWFAGSFVVAAVIWTTLMKACFGPIVGAELTVTWVVAVFGSWFLLVIPFMRKKEQIWKRLNDDQEHAVDAWFNGMSIFIGLLIASAFFWSFKLKDQIHESSGFETLWIRAVFGSWLVIVFPFLVIMYRQADRIFKNAVTRQTHTPRYKGVFIERSKRLLPENIAGKIKATRPTLRGGHVVTAILRDGKRVPHVFVVNSSEILGVYDREELGFEAQDVVDVESLATNMLPAYEEPKWLRLDVDS